MLIAVITSLVSFGGVALSAYLLFRSNREDSAIRRDEATVSHFQTERKLLQKTIDGLRSDIAELDGVRRLYYSHNTNLLRSIERYREWGYGLVRLLHDHGVGDLPPEPEGD